MGAMPYIRTFSQGESVAGARQRSTIYARVPHVVTLVLPTMTLSSTTDSSSILKDGKLKPGIYKIQNLFAGTYLDIHRHSKELCCRPAKDLEDGMGLVSRYPTSVLHVSDYCKWEIKQLGVGYTVQMVSLPTSFKTHPSAACKQRRV